MALVFIISYDPVEYPMITPNQESESNLYENDGHNLQFQTELLVVQIVW